LVRGDWTPNPQSPIPYNVLDPDDADEALRIGAVRDWHERTAAQHAQRRLDRLIPM